MPDLTASGTGVVDGALRAVAGYALHPGGSSQPAMPDSAFDDPGWEQLVERAASHGLVGLLTRAVAEGAFPASPEQADELARAEVEQTQQANRLELALQQVDSRFGDAGIEYRLLKGLAHAWLWYPDPGMRHTSDLDLLVPADDIDRAGDILAELGGRRTWPQPRSGYDREFGKGFAVRLDALSVEVDLHRTLDPGPFGARSDPALLFAAPVAVPLAGRAIPALDAAGALVHSCYHGLLCDDDVRAITLRDIAQLLQSDRLDPDEVLGFARAWRGEVVVAAGIRLADDLLRVGSPTLTTWAESFHPSRRDGALLESEMGEKNHLTRWLLTGFEMPGIGAKLRFFGSTLAPDEGARDGLRDRARRAGAALRPPRS